MAYEKQEWADDDTTKGKVTATRMTHIEQGIYDNSLATDKINPSGTATTTAEIEEGQINDVIGFKSLKLKGQTSQYTTNGYQLLDRSKGRDTYTYKGITTTYNADGSVTMRGTTTEAGNMDGLLMGNWGLSNKLIDLDTSSQYVLRAVGNTNSKILLVLVNGNNVIASSSGSTPSVFTPSYDGVTLFMIRYTPASANETIDLTVYPMLSKGNDTTYPYEPYTGGKASPNPDFPQEVNNVSGYNVVAINGSKNLFDKDINIVTPGYLNANGAVVTSDTTLSYQDRFIKVQPSTVYTISSGTSTLYRIAEYTSDKTFITRTLNANASRSYTFTTSSQTHFIKMAGTLTTILNTLQIEKGNTATSYIAHQGNNFSIDLPVENLFFLPNATITNGIEYTINNDGTFNIYGTASANTTISLLKDLTLTKIKANNYVFSVNQTLPVGVEIRLEGFNGNTWKRHLGGSPLNRFNSIKNGTADLTDVNKIRTSIYIPSGIVVDMKNVAVQFEEGSTINSFTPFGTNPIELCKIGTYQDYIFKKDGKWFKHNIIGSYTFDGGNNENWLLNSSGTYYKYQWATALPDKYNVANTPILCNYFQQITVIQGDRKNIIGIVNGHYSDYSLQIVSDISTLADFKAWLAENKPTVYYPLATPIDEEITYTPLIRQLDELYNSGLYDVTNISQDNSSEVFILDLEACKNNINGIVEYIRR